MVLNVADLVAARAASDAARPALFHRSGTETYGELLARADAIAARLRSVLHDSAPRVAVMCPNGLDYVALALGVLRAGACLVPVAGELALPERTAQLALTAPQVMLAAGPERWLPCPGVVETIVGIDFSWCALTTIAAFPEDRFAVLNPAFVRFSSGTTGDSKGVVLGHDTLIARVRSANRRLEIAPADRVLWTLPMAHHFAVSIVLYLSEGAGMVIEDSHLAGDLLTTARARRDGVLWVALSPRAARRGGLGPRVARAAPRGQYRLRTARGDGGRLRAALWRGAGRDRRAVVARAPGCSMRISRRGASARQRRTTAGSPPAISRARMRTATFFCAGGASR